MKLHWKWPGGIKPAQASVIKDNNVESQLYCVYTETKLCGVQLSFLFKLKGNVAFTFD